jgi:hypothetical protein
MGYTLSRDCSAIQQQAYQCEPSNKKVKEGDLERGGGGHKEAEIMGKTWKGQANS